jgi:hypothetical protein
LQIQELLWFLVRQKVLIHLPLSLPHLKRKRRKKWEVGCTTPERGGKGLQIVFFFLFPRDTPCHCGSKFSWISRGVTTRGGLCLFSNTLRSLSVAHFSVWGLLEKRVFETVHLLSCVGINHCTIFSFRFSVLSTVHNFSQPASLLGLW